VAKGQAFQLQRGWRFQQWQQSGSEQRQHSEPRTKEGAKDAQLPSFQTVLDCERHRYRRWTESRHWVACGAYVGPRFSNFAVLPLGVADVASLLYIVKYTLH
jgi:hypothetical protein